MKRVAFLLVLAVLAVGAGLAWYVRSAASVPADRYALPGLTARVDVWRDSLGVPHIWATTEADLFRALGFVHAQDRLFQLELFRRVIDGRLAEILGPEALDTDVFLRTIGLGRAAALNEGMLDEETRALLEAYAAGVNAWIETRLGPLPPEFLALRSRPEPWTVRHSLGIGKMMGWDLADFDGPLELQRAVDRVGAELAASLRPGYPAWGPLILPEPGLAEGVRRPRAELPSPTRVDGPLPFPPRLARELLDAGSIARASNAWVIGGERTRSGKPILANDMHLALRAPAIWYLAALHGGGLDLAGVTIPGAPGVVVGHSRNVAWGFTNAMVADVDFFVEQVDSADPTRYLAPDGWRAFEVRPETIHVRGQEPVVHFVRHSRHGPIVSDVDVRGGERVLALRWAGLEPSSEAVALLGMNRARDAAEFLLALRRFENPQQNVVFADAGGRFGYRLSGRVPVRRQGDGMLPVPGWTDDYAWLGFLAQDEHPQALDPVEGFVVTANNRQVGEAYPHRIGRQWAEPFRASRIRELIETGRDFTVQDVARQQMDLVDHFARRYLPHAVRAAEDLGDDAAARELRGWNAEASVDSRAAALFYLWYELLRRRIGEDEYRGQRMYFPRAAMNALLDGGDGGWSNDVRTARTERLAEQSAGAMREAVRQLGDRRWGELHQTRIEHALGRAAALDRLLRVNLEPLSKGGSAYTVNVAEHGGQLPFVNRHGASHRHVVDMADPEGSGGYVIPTGQSGNPFSRHYRDQTDRWVEGRLWTIPLDRARSAARAVHRMRLEPPT